MKNFILLLVVFVSLALTSCQKEDIIPQSQTLEKLFKKEVIIFDKATSSTFKIEVSSEDESLIKLISENSITPHLLNDYTQNDESEYGATTKSEEIYSQNDNDKLISIQVISIQSPIIEEGSGYSIILNESLKNELVSKNISIAYILNDVQYLKSNSKGKTEVILSDCAKKCTFSATQNNILTTAKYYYVNDCCYYCFTTYYYLKSFDYSWTHSICDVYGASTPRTIYKVVISGDPANLTMSTPNC